jgi:hypothetical protein
MLCGRSKPRSRSKRGHHVPRREGFDEIAQFGVRVRRIVARHTEGQQHPCVMFAAGEAHARRPAGDRRDDHANFVQRVGWQPQLLA